MGEIVSNFLNEIILWFQNLVTLGLAVICDAFLADSFSPSLDYFAKLFVMQSDKASATISDLDVLLNVFEKVGYTIMLVLIVYTAVIQWFGHVIEIKDSMIGVFKRCIWVIAMIYCIGNFGGHIAAVGEEIENNLMTELSTALGQTDEKKNSWQSFVTGGFGSSNNEADNGSEESSTAELAWLIGSGQTLEVTQQIIAGQVALAVFVEILSAIIQIFLYMIVAYNFAKLCIELIRRYVVYGFMYIFLPAVSGFLTTSEGAQVFMTYFKMFSTQIGILIATEVWIALSLFLMGTVETNLIGCFILIAFMMMGVRLEGFARDMGLSVTSQGMALLDSVATTGFIMGKAITGVGHAIGSGAIAVGAAGNMPGAVSFGLATTGKPIDPDSVARTMLGHPGSAIRGKDGTSINKATAELLNSMASQGGLSGNKTLQGYIASTNDPIGACQAVCDKYAGKLQSILDNERPGCSIRATGAFEGGPHGGIGVQILGDPDGNGEIPLQEGIISDSAFGPQSIAFTADDGTQKYLNLSSESLLDIGEGSTVPLGKEGETVGAFPTTGQMATGTKTPVDNLLIQDVVDGVDHGANLSNYNLQKKGDGYAAVYARDKESPGIITGYERNDGTFIGRPQHEQTFAEDYASGKHSTITDHFNSNKGMFTGMGFTATKVESNTNGGYIITGTHNTTGQEVKLNLTRALDNVTACTKNNTRCGWTVSTHKEKRKRTK